MKESEIDVLKMLAVCKKQEFVNYSMAGIL